MRGESAVLTLGVVEQAKEVYRPSRMVGISANWSAVWRYARPHRLSLVGQTGQMLST